jgi:hypothetical protein
MNTLPIDKQILSIRYSTKHVIAVYYGHKVIKLTKYGIERSCFGSGVWKEDKPWLDTEFWKDY